MSLRNFRQNVSKPRVLVANATYLRGVWVRNPTWAPLASVVSADEKFSGLFQVNAAANFLAFTFTTSSGTYHVDWGDGSTSDTASGTSSYHEYDFADGDLANTDGPVTFQDTGDTVTRTAHGYIDGMTISFATIVTTTGITAGQIYYVVGSTANTFQVSATVGGSAIALTTDGTGTILPYKQAVVTVTCNTGGATLTTMNLAVAHNQAGLATSYISGWLDIAFSCTFTSMTIGNSSIVPMRALQQVNIVRSSVTSYSGIFTSCSRLSNVVSINSSATVTNMSNMFSNCVSLQTVPLFNTASATDLTSMFYNCWGLQTVPLFNTANVTTMSNMFNYCLSLQTVPLFNTASVIDMSSMLYYCQALQTVPLFNTASVTNMANTLAYCVALQTVPLFNTANVTNMSNMFDSCVSLQTVPLFNTASATMMNLMFNNCSALQTVPLFNTANVTTMASMFRLCYVLQTVPLFNTVNVTNMSTMFQSVQCLQTVPLFNTVNVTNMSNMFLNCYSLSAVPALNAVKVSTMTNFTTLSLCCNDMIGIKATFNISNNKLSGTVLDGIYRRLMATGGNVTFTATSDIVTLNDHGLVETATVVFSTITTTTGITTSTTYYVRNPTTNTFQLSTTSGGSVIDLVNDGTGIITASARAITVSGNYGITSDTPSIATSKGWTVTGS